MKKLIIKHVPCVQKIILFILFHMLFLYYIFNIGTTTSNDDDDRLKSFFSTYLHSLYMSICTYEI